jgi:transcriptional regulator with XRE-family HTH domain
MQTVITRDEARKRIAGNVLLLMDEKGLNRSDLSDRSGVAHPRITLLVRGELLPNPADLWNVAEALGTTLDGLMKPLAEMANA